MSEQLPIGPIYDFFSDSYWRAVDSAGQETRHDYAESPPQHPGRDMARAYRGPDAETVLRGLPAVLRGDVPERVSSFVLEPSRTAPRTAAQAIIRMAQGPLRPPGLNEGM